MIISPAPKILKIDCFFKGYRTHQNNLVNNVYIFSFWGQRYGINQKLGETGHAEYGKRRNVALSSIT